MISEKAKGACRIHPARSKRRMHWGHRIGVGSLAGYIGEAMDGPPFCLAFVMVKESFVVPTIFFYLAIHTYKRVFVCCCCVKTPTPRGKMTNGNDVTQNTQIYLTKKIYSVLCSSSPRASECLAAVIIVGLWRARGRRTDAGVMWPLSPQRGRVCPTAFSEFFPPQNPRHSRRTTTKTT